MAKKDEGVAFNRKINIVDEKGNTLFTNSDTIDMARRFVQKGGMAAHLSEMETTKRSVAIHSLAEKYWGEESGCRCNAKQIRFIDAIYNDGFRCYLCWFDNPPKEKNKEIEDKLQICLPYIEKYWAAKHDNSELEIIKQYEKEVLKLEDKNE